MILPTLSRLLAALFLLVMLAGPSAAQIPGLPSTSTEAPAVEEGAAAEAGQASLDDLISILETDATRQRLIESLRSLAYQAPVAGAEGATPGDAATALSVPAMLAMYTRAGIEALQMGVASIGEIFSDASNLMAGTESIDIPRVFGAMLPVLSVALATFAAYFCLSFAVRPILDWLAKKARPKRPIRRLGLLAAALAVSTAKIFLSGVAGHVAAIVFDAGPPNFNQALFLNAFMLTGLIQVALSVFVAPYHPALRMTPFGDGQARYWYARLAFLIILLGYTFLFVAPIVEANSNLRAGNAVRFIVVIAAFLAMVVLIVQNRVPVRERLHRRAMAGATDFQSKVNYVLGHVWWMIALVFVFALFVLWLSSPRTGFQFMLAASFKSIAAITLGGLAVTILSRIILSGIKVPTNTKDRFPLLERRINGFIPKVLFILRVVVIAAVFVALLEAWNIAEFGTWLSTSLGQRIVGGGASALLILCFAFAVYLVMSSWVEYRLNPNFGTVPTARERTLLALFRNGFTIVLGVITMMLVLSQVGIDIAPLLAGAGVVGLAVGFGAQKLVQDIITGAFIQVENVMNEGDVVTIGMTSGVVEKLTIRSVSLRSLDGTYHLIPFSSVDQVSNMTKDFSNFVADIEVAYRENIGEVKLAMKEAFDRLRESEQGINIIADFEILGVETLGASSILIRGRIRTLPGKQWGVGRAYKEIIKTILDERDIEIPFPQSTLWFGTDKSGRAPPLHFVNEAADADDEAGEKSAKDSTRLNTAQEKGGGPIPPKDFAEAAGPDARPR